MKIFPFVFALSALIPASASAATDPIVGQWTFSGGIVTVTPTQQPGGFQGTVTKVTAFSTICKHYPGELMWKSLVKQPDGQYRGFHQYLWWQTDAQGAKVCSALRPDYFGRIALRVLTDAGGRSSLKVCFAPPEQPTVQPSIAPDGTASNAADGCVASDLTGGVPPVSRFTQVFAMPSSRSCPLNALRVFAIGVKDPPGDPIARISVSVGGKAVNTATRNEGLIVAAIAVPFASTGRPGIPRRSSYSVTASARTVLGRLITGTVSYRALSSFPRCG